MSGSTDQLRHCANCVSFNEDGSLIFVEVGRECGYRSFKLGPLLLNREYPGVVGRADACEGPKEVQTPKTGLLGRLGFKGTVLICPAVHDDLGRMVEDQIAWERTINTSEEED